MQFHGHRSIEIQRIEMKIKESKWQPDIVVSLRYIGGMWGLESRPGDINITNQPNKLETLTVVDGGSI